MPSGTILRATSAKSDLVSLIENSLPYCLIRILNSKPISVQSKGAKIFTKQNAVLKKITSYSYCQAPPTGPIQASDSSKEAPSGPSNPNLPNRCQNCFYLYRFQNMWELQINKKCRKAE